MSEDNFKENAYKMLYEKYKNVFERIYHEAKNHSEMGNDESKSRWMEYIGNLEKYSHCGIARKEDIAVISALEDCLEIKSSLKNAK